MYQLSIIIPIYNVGRYLQECLDSISHQITENVEVILVNDGSTDNSGEIASSFQRSNKNVVLIEQENRGLSAARNTGLNAAQGEYILFLDSDDYLAPDTVGALLDILKGKELDLLLFAGYEVYYDGEKIVEKKPFGYSIDDISGQSGLEMFCRLQQNGEYSSCVVLQCAKRSFLNANHIRFYPGILHEDHLYTFYVFMHARKCGVISNKYYCYRQRAGSIMYSKDKGYKNNFIGMSISFRMMVDWYLEHAKDRIEQKYCIWILKCLHDMREWTIWKYYLLNEKEVKETEAEKKEYDLGCCRLRNSEPYKVSVIIPIWNTEEHLEECLAGFAAQDIKNYEVILIVCSTAEGADTTAKKYVKKHGELFSLHELPGAGFGEAGNKGLDVAEGEYICFAGGGRAEPGALKALTDKAEKNKLDMLLFASTDEDMDGRAGIEVMAGLLARDEFHGGVMSQFVKRSMIEENGIRFYPDLRQGEPLFSFSVMMNAQRCGCTTDILYDTPAWERVEALPAQYRWFPGYAAAFCEMVRLYNNAGIRKRYPACDRIIRDYILSYEEGCFVMYGKEKRAGEAEQYREWIRKAVKKMLRFNRGREYRKQIIRIVKRLWKDTY